MISGRPIGAGSGVTSTTPTQESPATSSSKIARSRTISMEATRELEKESGVQYWGNPEKHSNLFYPSSCFLILYA